eukprot:TRINITY_DN28900_c0_g3_i1.p1 TRINITY_DN28900_c0_g3~~TRINITY_DN28900_c0_g3_i1.p1  ORF type:complete len:779 (-),score=185.98 TRINITY_DN28900_c0_g3_i1:156-2492(-)
MQHAACLVLALLAFTSPAERVRLTDRQDTQLPTLRVVHINDVYTLANMPQLKTLVDEKRRGAEKTLFTVGGDFLAPYLLSTFDKGEGMVKCLNKIGVDYAIFGNHEYDVGKEALNDRIKEMTSAGVVWINSNMPDFYDKSGIQALGVAPESLPPFADLVVVHEGSEKKIRLLGVLTDEVQTFSGAEDAFSGAAGTMTDPVETVVSMTKEAKEVDFVLPLVHLYLDAKSPQSQEPSDRKLAEALERAGPEVRNKIIALLGSHDHPKTGLHEHLASGLQLLKGAVDASHAAILDVFFVGGQPKVRASLEPVANYSADEEMLALVASAEMALEPVKSMVLSERHIQEMFPGKEVSWPLSSKGVREKPSNMASLLASLHTRAIKCDFSVVNGGAIRANQEIISRGLSVKQLLSELPFNNPVICLPVPGYVVSDSVHQTRDIEPPMRSAAYSHPDLYVDVVGSGRNYNITGFSRHQKGTDNWIPEAFDYQQEVFSEDVARFKEALEAKKLTVKDLTTNTFPGMKIFQVGQVIGVPPEDKHLRLLYELVEDWWPSKDAGLPQHTIIFGFFEEWLKNHIFQLMTNSLREVIDSLPREGEPEQESLAMRPELGQEGNYYDASDVNQRSLAPLLQKLLSHIEGLHAMDASLLKSFDRLVGASQSPLIAAMTGTSDDRLRESAQHLLNSLQALFTVQQIVKRDMSMDLKSVQLHHPQLQSLLELGEGTAAALAKAERQLRHHSLTAVSTIFQVGLLKQLAEDGNLLDHLVDTAGSFAQALTLSSHTGQ